MEICFKDNLKKLRGDFNVTQKQLADKLNTTVKTVSHWETGYSEPSLSQVVELSAIFNVSIDDLLTK